MKTRFHFAWMLAVLLSASLAFQTPLLPGSSVQAQEEPMTPFQQSLLAALAEREAAGLPVPHVDFTSPAPRTMTAFTEQTSATVITFENPQQAGYAAWPEISYSENDIPSGADGTVTTGNYSAALRESIASTMPGIWERYEFGQEPRVYTVEETLTYQGSESQTLQQASGITQAEILFGFTVEGPNISEEVHEMFEICYEGNCATAAEGRAWFILDWAAGLRLPMQVALEFPDPVYSPGSVEPTVQLTRLNWSNADYAAAGVPAENGDEFVLRYDFSFGAQAWLLGINVLDWSNTRGFDESASFQTPFGANDPFELPDIDLEPDQTGLLFPLPIGELGVGLRIHTSALAASVSASWTAFAESQQLGSGSLSISQPDQPASFSAMGLCIPGTNRTFSIQLDGFSYAFDAFTFQLNGFMQYQLWSYTFESSEFPIYTHAVNNPESISLGTHAGTQDFMKRTVHVSDNQPPTTYIRFTGTLGNNGWYVSPVRVELESYDSQCGPGVEHIQYNFYGMPWQPYSLPFWVNADGRTDIYYRAYDYDNNFEETHLAELYIDQTPPNISGTPVPAANAYGWNNTSVLIWFSGSDFQSGIASLTPDTWLINEGAGQSATGICVDNAGNQTSLTVSNVNIDKTPPELTISVPLPANYGHDKIITLTWQASDALSGLLTKSATLDGSTVNNGQSIDLMALLLGEHILTVQATDRAGNTISRSVTFRIITSFDSLRNIILRLLDQDSIHSAGVANGLIAKLNTAEVALSNGQVGIAQNLLNALLKQLDAQRGKQIEEPAYQLIRGDLLALMDEMKK